MLRGVRLLWSPYIWGMAPDELAIQNFLCAHFGAGATRVRALGAGMFSQAYAFDAEDGRFVIRLNAFEEDFRKDEFAFAHFAAPGLPISRVVGVGRFDETRAYCITQRCEGAPPAKQTAPVSAILAALEAIHAIDAAPFAGWGLTRADGAGRFPSWAHYILSLFNQKFEMNWPRICAAPFWDARLFNACYETMRKLLDFAPAQKWVLHGDFGLANLIAKNGQVTGVLDWAEMRLGDCVADVAYLDYWDETPQFAARWLERKREQGQTVPHFAQRLRCYKLNTALGGMIIASILNDEAEYAQDAARAEKVLAQV